MIHESYYDISFSIGVDKDIEFISIMDEDKDNITENEITNLLKGLLLQNKIVVGERCEGDIDITEEEITLTYRYCSELGEDYDTDVWDHETLKVSNT